MSDSINTFTPTHYDLPPGIPLILINNTSQTQNTNCQMGVVANPSHSISIKMLNGTGKINGSTMSKGHSMVLTVKNTQVIPITADVWARISFTNLGPHLVTAACS